jgi:hypothetical protein
MLVVLIPLHFSAMFCFIYAFWFVAKELKAFEMQRSVGFGEFAGNFFFCYIL